VTNLIAHVGGSQHGTRIGDFEVPAAVAEGGWPKFIDSIQPEIQWMRDGGYAPRIIIHNPFCYRVGADYELDQYQEAQRAGLPTVKDFARSWQKVASDVEVIGYLGHAHEPDFQRHLPSKPVTWANKAWDNVKPLLDAGMSIALDATCGAKLNTPEYESIDYWQSLAKQYNRQVIIECRPLRFCPHLHDWPSITVEGFWQLMEEQIKADGDAHWAQPKEGLTGEVMRWQAIPTGGWGGPGWEVAGRLAADVRRIQGEGHTPIVASAPLRLNGVGFKAIQS
jgi:hypothetical protein